jgi:guanylate kinase
MNKRIILVGPTCSGKNYIREKFREKGYLIDCSFTTRKLRPGEIDEIDYSFISKETFEAGIEAETFYEWVQYGDNYYGTGLEEWNKNDVFIMETDGVSKIKPEDRKECLVIFVNTPYDIRLKRMRERGWSDEKILERTKVDQEKFGYHTNNPFADYDIEISSQVFGKGLPHFK